MTIFATLRQKETINRWSLQIKMWKSSPRTSIKMRRVHSHERSSNATPKVANAAQYRCTTQLYSPPDAAQRSSKRYPTQLYTAANAASNHCVQASRHCVWTQNSCQNAGSAFDSFKHELNGFKTVSHDLRGSQLHSGVI